MTDSLAAGLDFKSASALLFLSLIFFIEFFRLMSVSLFSFPSIQWGKIEKLESQQVDLEK